MGALRDLIKNPTAAELSLLATYAAIGEEAARKRAFGAFAETGLPHRRMEAWKWTDFKLKTDMTGKGSRPASDPFGELPGAVICFSGSKISGLESLPTHVRAFCKPDAQALADLEALPLGAVTAALVPVTLMIEVTGKVEGPIRLVFEGTGQLGLARLVVVVREGASVDFIESHLGGANFNSSLLEFGVQKRARVSRTIIQPPSKDQAVAITARVHLDGEARFKQTALAFGADVARIETRAVHQESDAELVMNAAYLAGAGYHIDLTSHVRHGARNCVTRQQTKGAVMKGGTGVFQGKFHVPRNVGQKTDADMQHKALLLEEGAVVNAKPELEIYADDVECAHGNTCGALDAEQLFYLRQRGLPQTQAKAILTEAFIAEALDGVHHGAEEIMLASARAWLSN